MTEQYVIDKVSVDDFGKLFPSGPTVYDTPEFCALNAPRADEVAGFVLRGSDGTALAGQIMGLREGEWRAPFSAPFSVPSGDVSLFAEYYSLLQATLDAPLRLAWAPECYGVASPDLSRCGMREIAVEANFHYPMERLNDYKSYLSRSARYNFNYAMRQPFEFVPTNDVARAYSIIEANRRAMGYPLAMSLEQVLATVKIVDADFFVVTFDGRDVAAAMVYHVRADSVQLIYWGDLPEVRRSKAMNYMAYKILEWYAANYHEVKMFDVGPASTMGVRNEGLCEFKLSIGCIETPKLIIGSI